MYLNQISQLRSTLMCFLALLVACVGNPNETTISSPSSAPKKQQPDTVPQKDSNASSNTGNSGSPKPSNPVKTPEKPQQGAVNKNEASKQANEARTEAEQALQQAVYLTVEYNPDLVTTASKRKKRMGMAGAGVRAASMYVIQIQEALKKAQEAQAKASTPNTERNIARIKTLLAVAKVVKAAQKSGFANLKAQLAHRYDNSANKASIIATAKQTIQQARQTAQRAAREEREVVIPDSLANIFEAIARNPRIEVERDTTKIVKEYLVKIEEAKQAVEAL